MALTPRRPPSPEAQAAKLRGILESAVTAIITIDDRGLIESINPATERLFGYGAAELAGQNVKVVMPEPYKAEHDGYITNYQTTGVKKIMGIGREVKGRRKDGTTFPLHLSVSEFSADGRRCRLRAGRDTSWRGQRARPGPRHGDLGCPASTRAERPPIVVA